jgi:hypothetical protein
MRQERGSFVQKRSAVLEKIELCLETMDSCLIEAIGNDREDDDEAE